MNYKKNFFSKFKYVAFVVTLVSLVLFQLVMALSDDTKHIDSYIEWLDQDISRLIEVSVNNKFQVAKMLYSQNIDEEVAEQLGLAIVEGGASKDEVRQDFLERFMPLYRETVIIGLRQFQFHLPNTESFLRLHMPERHGDLLIDIRQTVNAAIRERAPVSGLEEGRFLNGYRYIFPILKGQQLVGTVEFSYSYYSIVKPVLDTYHLEAVFVMEKEEVERKGFEDVEKVYQKDVLYDLGYIDRDFLINGISERLRLSDEEFQHLNAKVKQSIRNKDFDTDGFNYVLSDNQLVWAMPMAIQDYTGKPVGTLVFYKNDKVLFELFGYQKNQMIYMYVTSGIVMLLIGLSIYFYMRIKIKATSDSLTRLYNRHYYMDNVVEKGVSGSLLMMDIDDFKFVNDTYGHNKGDLILKAIADILQSNIRESDAAIRWGGEEFLVILRNAPTNIAAKKGEYLLELIRDLSVEGIRVTVSIGVSAFVDNYDEAVKEADEALYYVKKHGKNAVKIYGDEQ
jgi:diguanylate cyclase (GGDEF)-like protein